MRVVLLGGADAVDSGDAALAQVGEALERCGHETRLIVAQRDVVTLAAALDHAHADVVFNLTESFAGKSALESNVAALLNLIDLRYTGSSATTLAVAGDKSLSKKVLAFHGVRTPEFATLYRGATDWAGDRLAFPLIIKPPQEDGSLGITTRSVVYDPKQLLETMGAVHAEFRQPVLVEQFIEGREFYVGVLGNEDAAALPVIELDYTNFPPGQPKLATWNAKWGENDDRSGAEYAGTISVFPVDVDAGLLERMQRIAVDAYHALRLRDYGRVDLRVTEDGEIYVIEVNPNCYLERSAEFARAADRAGIAFDALIARILELACARYAR